MTKCFLYIKKTKQGLFLRLFFLKSVYSKLISKPKITAGLPTNPKSIILWKVRLFHQSWSPTDISVWTAFWGAAGVTAGTQRLIFRCSLSLCNLTTVRLSMTHKTQICSLEVKQVSGGQAVTHDFLFPAHCTSFSPTHALFHILSAGYVGQQCCGTKIHTLD